VTELCSECGLEVTVCGCPPPKSSLMGMLLAFRDANDAGVAAATDPDC
jgi:hypothetical protein